jgi:nitrogen fixation/metabolism regulation signal transduction histidine kinase
MSALGQHWGYQRRVFWTVLAGTLPVVCFWVAGLWRDGAPPSGIALAGAIGVSAAWGCALAVRRTVVRPLRAVSNLLASLRAGDTTWRLVGEQRSDPLGLVLAETNALRDDLRAARIEARESQGLVDSVLATIDLAVLAFDGEGRVVLANTAAEHLWRCETGGLVGREARQLGIEALLPLQSPVVRELALPGRAGRFEVRPARFRRDGLALRLLVLSDLSLALREEERLAWQRLIRVLGHEINNSLAPIRSVTGSLARRLERRAEPHPDDADLREGLGLIESRAAALGRFLTAYARFAELPPPVRGPLDVETWVRRVCRLEDRVSVEVVGGAPCELRADADQLDILLHNLVRNAADAVAEGGAWVRVSWSCDGERLRVLVEDDGPGVGSTSSLFVPFFTTKPNGTGIGLVLSRRIAEAHGGRLELGPRSEGRGCRACVELPLE